MLGTAAKHRGDRFSPELIRVAALQSTSFRDRQKALQKTAATFSLRTKIQFPVNNRRVEHPLGRVVGRLDPLDLQKRPQVGLARQDLIAESIHFAVAAETVPQQ
jgi:hypothetical protein